MRRRTVATAPGLCCSCLVVVGIVPCGVIISVVADSPQAALAEAARLCDLADLPVVREGFALVDDEDPAIARADAALDAAKDRKVWGDAW